MRNVYNFSPGPSMLPEEVLKKVQKDFLDYNGCGMSVIELSHRGKIFEEISLNAENLLRKLMNIPDNYEVLFLQGGAFLQFEAVPLNLLIKGKADYVVTGNFAKRAFEEAQKFGDIVCVASSKDKNFTYIPKLPQNIFRDGTDYVHITSNNTIFGTKYNSFPKTKAPLVCDMSSNILSEVMDVNQFGLIYAGAQKNIGPAGLTIVIIRKNLIENTTKNCPTMLKYSTQAKEKSLYNTPPCFSIYVAKLVFEWLTNFGGVKKMQEQNYYKAGLLYDCLDSSKFYKTSVVKEDRSIMNVPFTTPSVALDEKFVKESQNAGLMFLKGHRLVGGMRASIYNAMPVEGVKKLIQFMQAFELKNKVIV